MGTKTERQTDLKHYAERRPKIRRGKTTEEIINRHAENLRRQEKAQTHQRRYKLCLVYSFQCVKSTASEVAHQTKKDSCTGPPKPPSETTTDFALPMTLPQTSIVIAEPRPRPKRKSDMRATTTTQPSQKRRRSSPSITESDESMASTQTCSPKSVGKQRTITTEETPGDDRTVKKEQIHNFYNQKYRCL